MLTILSRDQRQILVKSLVIFWQVKLLKQNILGNKKYEKLIPFKEVVLLIKIFVKVIDGNKVIIKSFVTPSQKIDDLKHQQWILFNISDSVITGFCSCTARHSKCCNHIAAVLYKIKYANEKGFTNPACTNESCQWN